MAYNKNNAVGGGCLDEDQGLTAFGRAMLDEMHRGRFLGDNSAATWFRHLDRTARGLGTSAWRSTMSGILRELKADYRQRPDLFPRTKVGSNRPPRAPPLSAWAALSCSFA